MSSRVLICVPGWGQNEACFEPLKLRLSPTVSCHVTTLKTLHDSVEEDGNAVSRYARGLDKLVGTFENVAIAGWSTGALVSLEFASRFPCPNAPLVLLAATPKFAADETFPFGSTAAEIRALGKKMKKMPAEVMKSFVERIYHPGEVPSRYLKQREVSAERMKELDYGIGFLAQIDLRKEVSGIENRALTLHGSEDIVIPAEAGRRLCALMQNATYTEISGAGHALLESHPDEVSSQIENFLG